jgi:2-polyprenyl-3-methyl-5-hydroxy-6-metoxy-1,4-benzoquinol methylase
LKLALPENSTDASAPGAVLSLAALQNICGAFHSDLNYLAQHYLRFADTLVRFGVTRAKGKLVLDVGAHWLQQSLLWTHAGARVAALDLPITFADSNVQKLAQSYQIDLLEEADLASAKTLQTLAESSVDIVLFTEVIEHLAFNPIALWQALYRVLKPGGVIVLSTPNAYRLDSRTLDWARLLCGLGTGVSVAEILSTHTFGHHWKEYSATELRQYFQLLSLDFQIQVTPVKRFDIAHPTLLKTIARALETLLPGLRPNLYAEVTLREKRVGITLAPRW